MRRRTLGNTALVVTALLTLTGLGVAIANAATTDTATSSECADVFLTTDPAGDAAGKLCTAVEADGTAVSGVALTFTPSAACTSKVMLRVSGVDPAGAEFGQVAEVACGSGAASASFTPVKAIAPDTFLCGTLLADRFTAAQACVALS
ncbi:hypothetical protein [Actinoplanes sp. L3-i22]|uniref:hypothetical protein n=1 Tax=Actinoplanes sp. L3-i22 TaxID=2836373 RepID=UPI001C76DD2F|nr:hypothetical protein [Actinoplanes sp. L3-i22]BCY10357.1 hypothetical protein L3i22_054450 [Actinoplanes sp. L3-i22]